MRQPRTTGDIASIDVRLPLLLVLLSRRQARSPATLRVWENGVVQNSAARGEKRDGVAGTSCMTRSIWWTDVRDKVRWDGMVVLSYRGRRREWIV